jgi:MATE family multidrug resistance protein
MTTPTSTILKKTSRLTFALAFSRLLNMITGFIGMIFVARLGHAELAASALITAIQGTLFLIGMSLLFAIGVMVGHAHGARNNKEVGSIVQQGLFLSVLISIPIILIMLHIDPILLALGQNPSLSAINASYFAIYWICIPAFMWMITLQQFLLAVNQQRMVILLSLFGLVVSITLAYGFIYGHFGLPRMGIRGLPTAFSIQIWLSCFLYFCYCIGHKEFKCFELFKWRLLSTFHLLKKLFKIGWPISIQIASDLLSFSMITVMVGWMGANELAAQQIVTQYFLLLVVPIFAIAQAGGILIGQARGAKDFEDIKRYGNTTWLIGLGFTLLVLLLFVCFPHELISLYTGSNHHETAATINLAVIVLIITGFRLVFDSTAEIKTGCLRGLYDTRFPMITGIVTAWVIGIPLSYLMGFTFHGGLIGVTLAGVISIGLMAIILFIRWKWQCKKIKASCV